MIEAARWWLYDRVVDLHYAGGWRTRLAGWLWRLFHDWWLLP